MVIIILGEESNDKTQFAENIKKHMLKPNFPEIVDGLPSKKPKGIHLEWKIYCTDTEDPLPGWCNSSHVIIFHV